MTCNACRGLDDRRTVYIQIYLYIYNIYMIIIIMTKMIITMIAEDLITDELKADLPKLQLHEREALLQKALKYSISHDKKEALQVVFEFNADVSIFDVSPPSPRTLPPVPLSSLSSLPSSFSLFPVPPVSTSPHFCRQNSRRLSLGFTVRLTRVCCRWAKKDPSSDSSR